MLRIYQLGFCFVLIFLNESDDWYLLFLFFVLLANDDPSILQVSWNVLNFDKEPHDQLIWIPTHPMGEMQIIFHIFDKNS